MAIVDKNDIQVHLPIDKLKVDDVPDSITQVQLDTERIVKGTLSGSLAPLTLAAWSTPDTTPEFIRGAGGRLAAALLYSLRAAQNFPDMAEYARFKYDEGMAMLMQVVGGAVTLPEVDEVIDTGGHISDAYFNVLPDPKFAMDSEF